MKLITLNIWAGNLKKPLLDFFKKYSDAVDIFCLQEVFDKGKTVRAVYQQAEMNIFSDIQKTLPNHTGYFHSSESSEEGEEGLAIFVRNNIKLNEVGEIFVYRTKNAMKNDDSKTLGRNLEYISFARNNSKYLVGNVHGLWNGKDKLDSEDRIQQSTKIMKFLDNRTENYKILSGDFNLMPDTASIRIIEGSLRNLIKDYGIKSTRTVLYEKDERFADYVFATPNCKIKNFEVLPEEVSDHCALLVEFE